MSQIDLLEPDRRTAPPPEERRSRYDVDCTPSPIAAQGVEAVTRGWLRPGEDGDAPRVLDVAAGAGSWSRAVRQRFPRAQITALEVRAEERPYLERWCDRVVIKDATELGDPWDDDPIGGDFDLVIGNIPFSLVDVRKPPKTDRAGVLQPGKSRLRAFEVFVLGMRPRLSSDRRSRLALYVPAAWWQRGEDIAALARENPPCLQLNIPLSISHRGPGKSAAPDAYAIYCWAHPSIVTGCSWCTYDLRALPSSDRKWTEMPGTETAGQ